MTPNSLLLIQQLQKLQQQTEDVTRCRESMQDACHRQDHGAFLSASIDAERHVCMMAVTTGYIKAQVVPADHLGDALESLSELVLRAVRMVLLAELGALRDVLSGPSARSRSHALFQGPFRSIDDLTSSMRDELVRITEQWGADRGMQRLERATYRDALRTAHAAMRELGASEDARFLRGGLTRTDWPALHGVCARMLAALAIRIDVDPDLPLITSCRPSQTPTAGQAS